MFCTLDDLVSDGSPTSDTEIFVFISFGQNKQQTFPNGHGASAIRTIQLGRLKALELRPDYAAAYNNICSAYNELRQWDKAIAACSRALKIKPQYPLARGNLNWAVQQKQQAD